MMKWNESIGIEWVRVSVIEMVERKNGIGIDENE